MLALKLTLPFHVERFEIHADYLEIEGFKKFLNFVADEEDIIGRPLTGVPDNEEIRFAMKSKSRHVKGTPKRSTVQIVDN
ncbi:MAG: hypothetical protein EZS28_022916 [Streblomastix strix]|uniref:Uncharacterized protein n=1 Tax=Streblomastix strix TaxID=222440 RepID=A0A5J4VG43_9EUKA|nr:MAG: hypothetical protein EZS28_022916 [Streblomastix strix]